ATLHSAARGGRRSTANARRHHAAAAVPWNRRVVRRTTNKPLYRDYRAKPRNDTIAHRARGPNSIRCNADAATTSARRLQCPKNTGCGTTGPAAPIALTSNLATADYNSETITR